MPNIVVISDTQTINVDFGDYGSAPNINTEKAVYPKRALVDVSKPYNLNYLMVLMSNGVNVREWWVSFQAVPGNSNVLIIDSIDATAPTTLDELYNLIRGLMVA